MNDAIKMQISAFVDGELPQNEAELLLRRMCQDRALRQQAAEYLAMGRLLRGERSVVGMDRLRDRVSAELEHKPYQEGSDEVVAAAPRFLRPIAGVAIAATVAVAVLLGLQQFGTGPEPGLTEPGNIAATAADRAYTVPEGSDDQLRDLYLLHTASSTQFGANSINIRLVPLLGEDMIVEVEDSEQEAVADETDESQTSDSAAAPEQ